MFALAHATNKIGRFTLIERWRNNERHLAPHENPLKILMKWGEYSSDVQFILQQSETKQPPAAQSANAMSPQSQQQQQQIVATMGTTAAAAVTSQTTYNNNNNNKPPMLIEASGGGGGNDSKGPALITTPPRTVPLPGKAVDLNNLDTYQAEKESQQRKITSPRDQVGGISA